MVWFNSSWVQLQSQISGVCGLGRFLLGSAPVPNIRSVWFGLILVGFRSGPNNRPVCFGKMLVVKRLYIDLVNLKSYDKVFPGSFVFSVSEAWRSWNMRCQV